MKKGNKSLPKGNKSLPKEAHKFRSNQQNPSPKYFRTGGESMFEDTCWGTNVSYHYFDNTSTTPQDLQEKTEESYPYTELTLDLLAELFAGKLSRFFYWTEDIESDINEKFMSGTQYGISFIPMSRVRYLGNGFTFSTSKPVDSSGLEIRFNIKVFPFDRAERRRKKKLTNRLKLTNEEFISIYSVEYSEQTNEEDEDFGIFSETSQTSSSTWTFGGLGGIGTNQNNP